MNTNRRTMLLATALACASLGATAQSTGNNSAWPNKPVRFTVPSAAGAAPDIMMRVLGDKLGKMWGQQVIIENKPGAGGLIGLAGVKSGPRDDHAFVFAPASVYSLTPYMYKNRQVDVVNDFVPVALVAMSPMMLAVSASSPINSVSDLIEAARKHPDFVVSTTSQFTTPHLAADLLSRAAGVPMRAMPYANSGQSMGAVVNGDAQAVIDGIPPLEGMVKGGRLKAVAAFSETRLPKREQLPTVTETIKTPSMVINGWFAVTTLKGTDPKAIDRVSADIATALEAPEVASTFDTLGVYPKPTSPAQFGAFWASERARWEKVLRDVGAPVLEQ